MEQTKLPVTVSTRKALDIALSSDLRLLFIEHGLRSRLGGKLDQIMNQAGFRIQEPPDHRGTRYVRIPRQ